MPFLNWIHPRKLLMMLLIGILTAGCGGGSDDSPTTSDPDPTPDPDPDPPAVEEATLARIQDEIFTPICSACHDADHPTGLQLDSEQASFDNLVEVPSAQQPDILRVDPGNPDDSYLVMKLEGHEDITGERMPFGQDPLSADEINLIRDWITNGAPQEGTGETMARLTLADSQKMGDGVQFTLRFSRPIQDSTFDPETLQVYLNNEDTRWLASPDSYEVQQNGQSLSVTVSRPDIPASSAELVIDDADLTAVLDLHGRQIQSEAGSDGESRYSASF